MSDNNTTIIGNATRDPELRFTTAGTAVCSFGVAINKRYRDSTTNEWKDGDPSFFNITAWRDLGEHVAATVRKGDRVIINGELKQRSWETDEGEKRSTVEIIADDIGPSLRWATAVVERVTRGAGGGSAAPEPSAPVGEVYGDEEPF